MSLFRRFFIVDHFLELWDLKDVSVSFKVVYILVLYTDKCPLGAAKPFNDPKKQDVELGIHKPR